jgi:glycerophosphoryl diester phosphodiesterase
MHALIVYEEERTGQFIVNPGWHGGLNILSAERYLIGIMESSDPLNDFHFELDCFKDGKIIGKCSFTVTELFGSTLIVRSFPIKGSPDGSTITFSICWVTPFNSKLSPKPFTFPTLFTIGHRGFGSNKITKEFLENSMEGFIAANSFGADFIEFDVQMSKDGVPVIYHDLIGIITDSPILNFEDPQEITPDGRYRYVIQQFSEEEFRQTGLFTNFKTERSSFAELLTKLPESLGFDVEIKYPSRMKLNTVIPYMDMNEMINKVLKVMEEFAGNRRIMFSSFDPIICIMLKLKQQRWPVFQLLCRKKRWIQKEMIDRGFAFATFHQKIGIEGFVCDCVHLLESPEVLKMLLNSGFHINTYGILNNTREGIEKQLELGIRGFCTDNLKLCRSVIEGYVKS